MGWILWRMALLFALHTMAASAELEVNKEISRTGHPSLESFLRNVLDSSQELAKIRNEVRAHEELDNAIRHQPVNGGYSQTRQRRRATQTSGAELTGKTTKDTGNLRRVLNLYMKRAQMFRRGKGENLIEDSQQKLLDSNRGKRDFPNLYVILPSGKDLQNCANTGKCGQEYNYKQRNSERKKIRSRRRCKSGNCGKSGVPNINNEISSIVQNQMDIFNREADATSLIQPNNPASNTIQKGTHDVSNIASHQGNNLPNNSVVSKRSGNTDSSVNLLSNVIPGSHYDLDCVHEIPSLEESLYSRGFRRSSSLTDKSFNVNEPISANDIALTGQKTDTNSKFAFDADMENHNAPQPLNEMANGQEKVPETSEGSTDTSNESFPKDGLDIANPIVIEVLQKVNQIINETTDDSSNTETVGRLTNIKNTDTHYKSHAKTSSADEFARKQNAFRNIHNSADKKQITAPKRLIQKFHENESAKKQPLISNTVQISRENGFKNSQSTRSKTHQISHKSDLTKTYSPGNKNGIQELLTDALPNSLGTAQNAISMSDSGKDVSSKSVRKQDRVPTSNTKEKINQLQISKLPASSSEHKTSDHINQPISKNAAPVKSSIQKSLPFSGQGKIPLYPKSHTSLPKAKINSEIVLKTELLHSSKKEKVSNIRPKSQNKAKNSEVSLKQKPKNTKQKRNTLEKTSETQQQTEDAELKENQNERNAREVHGNILKQQNNLAFSKSTLGGTENMKSFNALNSQNHDQMSAEEVRQSEDSENDQKLLNINKRSSKPNKRKHQQELLMSEASENLDQENELSTSDESKFSESLRRKRYASRFKSNLRKRKRQYWQDRESKSNSGGEKAYRDYNVSPNNIMVKHTDSEKKEDNTHQNMLRQVEDMILALKEDHHKANERLKYGNEYSQRIGRRLHSAIDESRENSDGSNDNDDYYYYDEDDVDKRRPEHSKVSHKLYKKEILDKLDHINLMKKEIYDRKPFGLTEYSKAENPANVGSSNNNDPSHNRIQSEQVPSDLITNESNKMSLFNKGMPKEVIEAHYNRSATQNERGKDYEENIFDRNSPQNILSLQTYEVNKNISTDENNPESTFGKRITTDGKGKIDRLNEGRLAQLNKALNEIVLNQTTTSWDEIDQDAIGYNAHMRYKRAGNVHEMDSDLKSEDVLDLKKEYIFDGRSTVKENSLERSMNLGESNIAINANVRKKLDLEIENQNCKAGPLQTNISSTIDIFSGTTNKSNILHHTVSKYTNDDNNKHNIGENNKTSTTKSVTQTPRATNHEVANIISDKKGTFNVSEHSNATRETEHTQTHSQTFRSPSDIDSRDNDMLLKDVVHLGVISRQHEDGTKVSDDLQKFNSSRSSFNIKKLSPKRNKNHETEEQVLNNGIRGNELTDQITEQNKNDKAFLKITDKKAKDSLSRYESITPEIHLAEVSKETIRSPDSETKYKEMSPESSNFHLRSKRNGEYYNDLLEEQPEYSDYSEWNEVDDYTQDNETTDTIVVQIVLTTTKPTTELTVSGDSNTTLGDYQPNTTTDNVTSPTTTTGLTEARESFLSSPKPDHGHSDSQIAKKKSIEYQSFNVPRDYNDNSQLNITINGALASKMVDVVFEAVNASDILKLHLGSALRKTDYGSQEKQPTYDTGTSKQTLEQEEEQYHQKTGSLLSKVMELLDVLVEEEVSKRSCITLQPELHDFLLWMLEIPETGKVPLNDFRIPDNFLFMKQNKHLHDKIKDNETVVTSGPQKVIALKDLNRQIELLRNLTTEYLELPDREKAKVNYVHTFLMEQLQALEEIRHSEEARLLSKVDDSSKSHLQGTKGFDADLKSAKRTQKKLRYKKQNNLPHEAPLKDSKYISSAKEDRSNSKINLGNKKSSFESTSYKHISHDTEDHGISNKNQFKTGLEQHSANNWSKGKPFMKDMSSEPEEDTSKSHNPVHHSSIVRAHQRRRRFGGHRHDASRNKRRNIANLHFPTMRYRKLLKRAAEFRERRSKLM